ncbi:MAG: hypothetical protein IT273_06475, partial [Chitinophagales bacterium]|nr:hypothetical protein [Chitinophagales bacterium]
MLYDHNGNFILSGPAGDNFFNSYLPFVLVVNQTGALADSIDRIQTVANATIYGGVSTEQGYALVGVIDSVQNNSNGAAYLYLLDTGHQVINQKIVGSTQYTNHAQTVCRTPDGGFLLGGEIQPYDSTVVGPPTHPYLIRLDPQGN